MPTFRPCPPVAPEIVTAVALIAVRVAVVTIPGATGRHGLKVGTPKPSLPVPFDRHK